jgi:acetate kinase
MPCSPIVTTRATQVAVFDTAFHQTMPPKAFVYGLPYHLYEEEAVRKYGFHGSSYSYLIGKASEMLRRPAAELNLIVCHLGAPAVPC